MSDIARVAVETWPLTRVKYRCHLVCLWRQYSHRDTVDCRCSDCCCWLARWKLMPRMMLLADTASWVLCQRYCKHRVKLQVMMLWELFPNVQQLACLRQSPQYLLACICRPKSCFAALSSWQLTTGPPCVLRALLNSVRVRWLEAGQYWQRLMRTLLGRQVNCYL